MFENQWINMFVYLWQLTVQSSVSDYALLSHHFLYKFIRMQILACFLCLPRFFFWPALKPFKTRQPFSWSVTLPNKKDLLSLWDSLPDHSSYWLVRYLYFPTAVVIVSLRKARVALESSKTIYPPNQSSFQTSQGHIYMSIIKEFQIPKET